MRRQTQYKDFLVESKHSTWHRLLIIQSFQTTPQVQDTADVVFFNKKIVGVEMNTTNV